MRLKDWLKTGALHALAAIGGSGFYGVLMFIMDTEYELSLWLEVSVVYLVFFGAFMSFVLIMSVQKQNLPLALSFGATRKEAFWGMQCYHTIYMLLIMAVTAVLALLALLTGEDGAAMAAVFVPLGLAAMLAMGAIGSMCGVVSMRFGKGAAIAVGVVAGILMVGILVAFAVLIVKKAMIDSLSGWAIWLFPAIGLVAHIGSMVLEHKTIYKYNVKL